MCMCVYEFSFTHGPLITYINTTIKSHFWVFHGSPVAQTSLFNAGGMGSIPDRGAKIPYASKPKKVKHETEAILQQIQ